MRSKAAEWAVHYRLTVYKQSFNYLFRTNEEQAPETSSSAVKSDHSKHKPHHRKRPTETAHSPQAAKRSKLKDQGEVNPGTSATHGKHPPAADTNVKHKAQAKAVSDDQNSTESLFKNKKDNTNVSSADGAKDQDKKRKKRKKKKKNASKGGSDLVMSVERLKAYGINPKKFKYTQAGEKKVHVHEKKSS